MQWKYAITDIEIRNLDFGYITEYDFWLRSVRKCNHNTTIKYLGNFRKIINRCIRNGWLSKDPFLGFKMTRKEVERAFLTEDELQLLRVKVFATDRLNQVRDIFLFCCFTGLAYADVKKLQRSEICIGIDGDRWIFTSRQKTESPSRIPLLPFASDIIDHYKDEPTCMQKGRVLPVPSNQKVNAYLKDLKRVPKESLAECQTQSQGEGKNQQQKTKESTGQKQKNGESLQLPKKKGKINLEISLTKNMAMN